MPSRKPGSERAETAAGRPSEGGDRGRGAGALLREIGATLATYVRAQLIISSLEAAVFTAGFALLGVPLWLLIGPLCGFLYLVPRIGGGVAMVIGVGVAALGGLDWVHLLGVIGLFVVVFTVEGFVLSPWLLGRRLKLRPLYVFLAVLLGGALFGLPGLLLAVPVVAVLAVIWRFFATQ